MRLQVRHFEVVAKAAAEFDQYLIRTTGYSDDERAAFNLMRADNFGPSPRHPMTGGNMGQARSYGGAAQTAFGGGSMGGTARAAFGNPAGQMQGNYGGGGLQQNMQGMNQGNFGMSMGQAMQHQQPNYGMQHSQQSAQSAYMGMSGGGQMANQWAVQNPNQSAMGGMQQPQPQPQIGVGSMPGQVQQVSGPGQDAMAGQQQQQNQGHMQGGTNLQAQQGFMAAASVLQQFPQPQQGQGFHM